MNARWRWLIALLAVVSLLGGASVRPAEGAVAGATPNLEVSISRAHTSGRLGESFGFATIVNNNGKEPVQGLVAHLNIASLDPGVYVDPEDWSTDRTRYLGSLAPGESVRLPWRVKPVNAGQFAVYVAALGDGGASGPGSSAVSPVMRVGVAEHRSLNPGGILPLVLGIPLALGLLAVVLRERRRRSGRAVAGAS